jgi:thiol-disulfide isomerase/thioredoxin
MKKLLLATLTGATIIGAGSVFAVLPAFSTPALKQEAAKADLPTWKAKTVQFTATYWGIRPAPVGQPFKSIEKIRTVALTIDRMGNRARMEEILPVGAPDGAVAGLLVADGKTQYEVLSARKQYTKTEVPAAEEGIRSSTFSHAGIAFAMGWKSGSADKFTSAPDEILDGKKARVYSRTNTVNGKDAQFVQTYKMYVDTVTALPMRFSMISQQTGKEPMEISRVEFSDWKLDATVNDALFVWNAPVGITEYRPAVRPPLLIAGTVAPDFTVPKYGGGELKLSDYRGKVVILDFWATWCGPCQMTMPHIEKVYRQTKDKGVVTLGLCVWDEKAAYEKWVPEKKDKYTFQFAFDPAGRAPENIAKKFYQVSGIPTTYVIDRDGKVVDAIVGYREDDDRLENALKKAGITL